MATTGDEPRTGQLRRLRVTRDSILACLALLAASKAQAAETRCWIDRGAIVVPAALGDIAGDFILDLARKQSALHDTRANADGLTEESTTAPLTLGGMKLKSLRVTILDLDRETRTFDTTINGILGADILPGRVLTLDLRGGQCRLRLSRTPPRALPGDIKTLPPSVASPPGIEAIATDGLKVRRGFYALGTSHSATLLNHARLTRDAAAEEPARLRGLEIAGRLHEQTPAQLLAVDDPNVAGEIGTAVLSGARIVIDARQPKPSADQGGKSSGRPSARLSGSWRKADP